MDQLAPDILNKEADPLSSSLSRVNQTRIPFTSPYLLAQTERELRLLGVNGIEICAADLDGTLWTSGIPISKVRETLEHVCNTGSSAVILTSRSDRGFVTIKEELDKVSYHPGRLFVLTADGLCEKTDDGWENLYTLRIVPQEAKNILSTLYQKISGFSHTSRAERLINDLPVLKESWPEKELEVMEAYPGVLYVGSKITIWPLPEHFSQIEDIIRNGNGDFIGSYRAIKHEDAIDIVPNTGLDPKMYAIHFLKDYLEISTNRQIVVFGNSPHENDAAILSLPNSFTINDPSCKASPVCKTDANDIESVLAFHDAIYAVTSAAGINSSSRGLFNEYRAFFERLRTTTQDKGKRVLVVDRRALLDLELEERHKLGGPESTEELAKRIDLPTYHLFNLVRYGVESIPKFFSLYTLLRDKALVAKLREEGSDILSDPAVTERYKEEFINLSLEDSLNQLRLRSIVTNLEFLHAFELAFSYKELRVSSSSVFVGDEIVGNLHVAGPKPYTLNFSPVYSGLCSERSLLEALAIDVNELGWELQNIQITPVVNRKIASGEREKEIFRYLDPSISRSISSVYSVNDDHPLSNFDPVARLFSALKYFDPQAIEEACRLLFDHLVVACGKDIIENPDNYAFVTSNPFTQYDTVIGNVTTILAKRMGIKRAFVQNLDELTNEIITRKPYASINSTSEREQRLIDEDPSYRLFPSAEIVEGKTVVFIDDVINTGMTIKHSIRRLVNEATPAEVFVVGILDLITDRPRMEYELGEYLVSASDSGHVVSISEGLVQEGSLVQTRRFFGLLKGLSEVEFLAYMRGFPPEVRRNLEKLWKLGEFPDEYNEFLVESKLATNYD